MGFHVKGRSALKQQLFMYYKCIVEHDLPQISAVRL